MKQYLTKNAKNEVLDAYDLTDENVEMYISNEREDIDLDYYGADEYYKIALIVESKNQTYCLDMITDDYAQELAGL